ncbi:helix-turn-helix domain-containing protein [Pseudomonas syringae]|nr:helix-turn-helix transcriptional regulator [Pseudomonas syringae]
MSKLVRLTHACLSEIITLSPPYNPLEKLSTREVEVLKWVADGKTGEVNGKVLGVTERTVTHHTVNIMQKLNATNKTAAAVKAALLGII